MPIHKFNTFLEMKNSNFKSNKKNRDIIKELDNMCEVLSKNVRKLTEKDMIY